MNLGIQSGFHTQSAGSKQRLCHGFVITGQDQILFYLLIYGIGEVRAGSSIGFLIVDIIQPDTFVYRIGICHGFIVLCLTDKAKLQHFVQTFLSTYRIVLRMPDRVVLGRILRDAGDDRAFRDGQIAAVLAEITQGCGFDTQCILSQVDSVHIAQQDLILAVIFGDLQGEILLLDLTFDLFDLVIPLGSPVGEDGVLQQLLGDGTCTLGLFTAGL